MLLLLSAEAHGGGSGQVDPLFMRFARREPDTSQSARRRVGTSLAVARFYATHVEAVAHFYATHSSPESRQVDPRRRWDKSILSGVGTRGVHSPPHALTLKQRVQHNSKARRRVETSRAAPSWRLVGSHCAAAALSTAALGCVENVITELLKNEYNEGEYY